MTWRTKRRIMLTVTVLMAFGFVMMMVKGLYIPCAILAGVWVFPHPVLYLWGEDPGRAPGGLTNIQNRKEQLPRA